MSASGTFLSFEQAEALKQLGADSAAERLAAKPRANKGRSGTKIRLGRVGDELDVDGASEVTEEAMDEMDDHHEHHCGGDDTPLNERSAREEEIARRMGIETRVEDLAPHIAGSGGHSSSPDRSYGGSDASGANTPAATRLTLPEYKARAVSVLREFYLSGDYDEVRRCFDELATPFFGFEFVRRALMLAMEAGDKEREAASRLLSAMYANELSMEQIGKGFERLFETIDDISVDVPAARGMAAKFTARAVVDEVLPPGFLMDGVVTQLAGDIADQAKALLSMRLASERLEHCWGVTTSSPLPKLKAAVVAALKEYYLEPDAGEAARCLKELGAPFFQHETVYRALLLAIDQAPAPLVADRCVALLAHLHAATVVSEHQTTLGFRRMLRALPDATVDNPHAHATFDRLVAAATGAGLLPARWNH